ncbi:MAG: tetratricopeptide repeat protein [Planctomycetaceae bacterium]
MLSDRHAILATFGLVLSVCGMPGVAPGDESKDPAGKSADFRQQIADDVNKPLDAVQKRAPQAQARLDAMAWFMTGKLRQSRNDLRGALKSYEKAIAIDPEAIEVYRELVPLAFRLNQTAAAVKYSLKAVELDPNDFLLLRQLGMHMARQEKLPEAIRLLSQAASAETLDRNSGLFVSLHRDLAILHQAVGNHEKTADSYEVVFDALTKPIKYKLNTRVRRALMADPMSSFERMGQTFLTVKRYERAIAAFRRAVDSKQRPAASVSFSMAQVYRAQGERDAALKELQKYFDAQLQSKGRAPYELLAEILEEQKRQDQLLPKLTELVEKDPRNPVLHVFLADQYVAQKQFDKAEVLLKATLKDSKDAEGYLGLIRIYRQQNRADDLLQSLTQAARGGVDQQQLSVEMDAIVKNKALLGNVLDAGRKAGDSGSQPLGVDGDRILARLAASANQNDDAVAFYERAVAARPGRDKAFSVFQELGSLFLQLDRFGDAADIYQQATEYPLLRSERPRLLLFLSQALELNGETQAALAAVSEARNLLPQAPILHYQEAWVYYHSRQWDQAIRLFQSVMQKFPQDKSTIRRCQFSLSNIFVQQGEIRKGEEILEEVLKQDPDDPSVNNDLGYLYADQGKKLEQAEEMIRKAVTAEPENAAYLDSLGWVLFKLGKTQEAQGHLERATEMESGGDATIWDHLGDCYAGNKKSDQARKAWRKALENAVTDSHPDQKLIKKIRAKLNQE